MHACTYFFFFFLYTNNLISIMDSLNILLNSWFILDVSPCFVFFVFIERIAYLAKLQKQLPGPFQQARKETSNVLPWRS